MTFSFVAANHRRRSWIALLCALFVSLLLITPVRADPAGRVGRLSWFSGAVTVQSPDTDDTAAMLNWPLTSGHRLIIGPDARAEVQIGSTMLQLASRSIVEFVQVDDERVRVQLLDGSLTARLYSPEMVHEFEIVTREGGFQPLTAGFFRVDVDHSSSAGTVYSGRLRFMAFDQTVNFETGQRAQFWHDGRTQHRFLLPENDEFARWAAVRDQQYGNPLQARYVPAEMTGANHLDAYGRWYDSPEYGAVWYPQTVAADWAPYRNGRWAWVSPWGWTWIGIEPWGFAPFHYGRWVFHRNAWGWVPGQRVNRPVYAPALVAWLGNPGSAVAPVGWFPLAPREVYRPAYRSSELYLRALNGPHAPRNFNYHAFLANPQAAEQARYAHHGQPRAMTMVPAETLLHRRLVGDAIIPERDRRHWAAQPVQFQAPVAAPHVDRREGDRRADFDRRENDRRQELDRRAAMERRQEIDRRRDAERAQETGTLKSRENGAVLPGAGRAPRLERPVDSTPATPPVSERPDRQAVRGTPSSNIPPAPAGVMVAPVPPARSPLGTIVTDRPTLEAARPVSPPRSDSVRSPVGGTLGDRPTPEAPRPVPPPRSESVRLPVGGALGDRPAPEAARPVPPLRSDSVRSPVGGALGDRPAPEAARPVTPPRPERIEQRPTLAAPPPLPTPVPPRVERAPLENRPSERAVRRDDPPGHPGMNGDRARSQPSQPVPVSSPPLGASMPAERSARPESSADPRGRRERHDERRGPGIPDRP
ncbi:MAG: hypothetical protein JNL84_01425 [Candidatus Accumulibacter sp.]|nr:hypothetical protein [Accumulibacter sp.]